MELLWITLICILWDIVCGNVRNESKREKILTGKGVCFTKDSNGENQTFCCNNYENIKGECKKCDIGYRSAAGKACRPCPNDVYGHRCSSVCKCTIDERCDHVIGCVPNIMRATDQGKDVTYVHHQKGIEVHATDSPVTIDSPIRTADYYGNHTYFQDRSLCRWSSSVRDLVFFSSGILICVITFNLYLYIRRRYKRQSSSFPQPLTVETAENIPEERNLQPFVNYYETIDESNITDNNISNDDEPEICHPSSSSGSSSNEDIMSANTSNGDSDEIINASRDSHHISYLNSYFALNTESQDIHLYQRAVNKDRTHTSYNTIIEKSRSYENLRLSVAQFRTNKEEL